MPPPQEPSDSLVTTTTDGQASEQSQLFSSGSSSQPIALRVLALVAAVTLRWFNRLGEDWTGVAIVTILAPTIVQSVVSVFRRAR